MENTFLPKVYGLWGIKEELRVILGWYQNVDVADPRRKILPHGLLFYGNPGMGKTLLLREYSALFDCPVLEVTGESEDAEKELMEVYEKASKHPFSVVIIDEIDNLIGSDGKLIRILQGQLDGFKQYPNVLTLASANDRCDLPESLLRQGRFDRCLKVSNHDFEEMEEIIRGFLGEAGTSTDEEDIYDLARFFYAQSTAHVRAAIFAAALRKGEYCTAENLRDASFLIKNGYLAKKKDLVVTKSLAIHEAGHACYLYYFCKSITYERIHLNEPGGVTAKSTVRNITSFSDFRERLRCSLAGAIAETLLLGTHEYGCQRDLDDAYEIAYNLANYQGIQGLGAFCPSSTWMNKREHLSERDMRRYEDAARKLLLREYRTTKRQMKRVKKGILRLAEFLLEHKKASREEIRRVLEANKR